MPRAGGVTRRFQPTNEGCVGPLSLADEMLDAAARGGEIAGRDGFAAVLVAARGGAPAAFETLHAMVAGPVHGFLRARGADDPEGLANEVLLRAFRGIDGFEGDATAFRSWVFAIARNALADQHRRRQRRPRLHLVAPDDMPHAPGAVHDHAAVLAEERVTELLADLTPDQREVLLLRVVADLPVREVARVMERTEGAVKLLQHRALEALRKKLSAQP